MLCFIQFSKEERSNMPNISPDGRGIMIQRGNVWRVHNALVEEVSVASDGRTGFLLISYAVMSPQDMTHIELLRLNVGRNTAITHQFGRPVCLCQISSGMWIDAEFSPAMTRSIPPQTNAFRIVVRQSAQNPAPPPSPTTTDRIVSIDTQNSFLITGSPNDINRQTRFVVTDKTVILDRNGRRILLRSLRPGQWIIVTHANFMTASIPPQTTAFRIQVL